MEISYSSWPWHRSDATALAGYANMMMMMMKLDDRPNFSSELAPNMFGAISELAIVMEFGFNLQVLEYQLTDGLFV